jgi:hypothetical protein
MALRGGMNSRSIIADVLARCFLGDLFHFMGFHDEDFVNERIIGISILRVAAHPEHGPPCSPVSPMKDL